MFVCVHTIGRLLACISRASTHLWARVSALIAIFVVSIDASDLPADNDDKPVRFGATHFWVQRLAPGPAPGTGWSIGSGAKTVSASAHRSRLFALASRLYLARAQRQSIRIGQRLFSGQSPIANHKIHVRRPQSELSCNGALGEPSNGGTLLGGRGGGANKAGRRDTNS